MRAWRQWLVQSLMAVVVGGHLCDIATGSEHWPFSPYPMYSHVPRWTMEVGRIMAVPAGGGAETIWRAPRFLAPFDQSRLLQGLDTLLRAGDRPRVTAALEDCLVRYERRRRAGEHDGPALHALRYYRMRWELDPAARDTERPAHRDLVVEVTLPEPAA